MRRSCRSFNLTLLPMPSSLGFRAEPRLCEYNYVEKRLKQHINAYLGTGLQKILQIK